MERVGKNGGMTSEHGQQRRRRRCHYLTRVGGCVSCRSLGVAGGRRRRRCSLLPPGARIILLCFFISRRSCSDPVAILPCWVMLCHLKGFFFNVFGELLRDLRDFSKILCSLIGHFRRSCSDPVVILMCWVMLSHPKGVFFKVFGELLRDLRDFLGFFRGSL